MEYLLSVNERHQCNLSKCQVTCKQCPAGPNMNCAHSYRCTCKTYAEENQCEHLHFRATLANGGIEVAPHEPTQSQPQPSGSQFPKTTRKRAHSPMRQTFPNKPKKRKTGKAGRHGKYEEYHFSDLLDEMLDKDVEDYGWGYLVCTERKTFLQSAAKLGGEREQQAIDKFDEAIVRWMCNACAEYTPDKAKLNYVCCDRCDLWYHEACTNRDEADRAGDDDFECDKCVTE
jgi:hypothetical protein